VQSTRERSLLAPRAGPSPPSLPLDPNPTQQHNHGVATAAPGAGTALAPRELGSGTQPKALPATQRL